MYMTSYDFKFADQWFSAGFFFVLNTQILSQ